MSPYMEYAQAEAMKQALEAEMEALASELTSGKNPGVCGPLVDSEGFPRADMDVYRVRHLRHELVLKQNDHKEVMRTIERLLPMVFEAKSGRKVETKQVAQEETHKRLQTMESKWKQLMTQVQGEETQLQPFALVQSVQNESPAERAGLQTQDQVLKFGSADATNHRELAAVRDIAQSNIGSGIRVVVRRQQETLAMELTPMSWNGPGVLGCVLQPL